MTEAGSREPGAQRLPLRASLRGYGVRIVRMSRDSDGPDDVPAWALEGILERLRASAFRAKFRLGPRDREYLTKRGLDTVMEHGADFVATRLAPAEPPNDGKQTPWRGHPVFVAQHATATCCRGCLEKWHRVPKGRELREDETAYVLAVIRAWLEREAGA